MALGGDQLKALFFAAIAAVVGAILVGAGSSNGDMVLMAGGAASIVGAGALVAVSFGVLRHLSGSPRRRGPKLKHVWRPAEDGSAPPPATEQEIAAVERAIGHGLPAVYKRMLALQNGGDLRYPLWVSSDSTRKQLVWFAIYELSGVGPHDSLAQTPSMVREGLIPKGLACIMDGQEWDLCLDYRTARQDQSPSVVALDEDRKEFVLAATMEEFVAGLSRDLRHHAYVAQGVIGKHPDLLLMELNEALGVQLAPTDSNPTEYRAEHSVWRSPATRPEPAVLRLARNGADRNHSFPETWSKWLLCCDIAPVHREELERRLRKTDSRWILLHAPPQRLLEGGFFGSVEPVGLDG